MQFKLFKTFWGFAGPLQQAIDQVLAAEFDGLEAPAPTDANELEKFAGALEQYRLDYIAEICTAGSYVPDRNATPAQHLADFETKLIHGQRLRPRFFNVMAGCDAWPLQTQIDFFQRCVDIAARHDVICSFETHRGRSFFNPWVTRDVVAAVPGLLLTCDFSHWAVVSERLPDCEWDTICEVAQRAHHIHGRIGYAQGPQVPHPAAPEYADCLLSHQRCWEAIWSSQIERGYTTATMTPEFGPDGYLHCLPFTNAPVADLWQINCWMGSIERTHFERFMAAR
ncbi:MAG TPA: TIM barrel protein [Spongiibacteraceae bacterium]|nr:TIM barrel protein [Spongiibacteraceae bacterium]